MTADLALPKAPGRGLSSEEARTRLVRDGGNVLPTRRATPLWRRTVTQLRDPLVLVLLAAAGFTRWNSDTIVSSDWATTRRASETTPG